MSRRVVAAVVTALLLVLASVAPIAAGDDGASRPWSGRSSGQSWFDVSNPKGCGAGITTRVQEPAVATHFGATLLTMSHCPTGDFAANYANADISFVAANGDAIFGTYVGNLYDYEEVVGHVYGSTIQVTITGGDGRFEGATGAAVMEVHGIFEGYDDLSWAWWATWKGSLSY